MARIREKALPAGKAPARHVNLGLSDQELIDLYRQMFLIRSMDERIWLLNRQGKVPIAASSQGHEGAEMGSLLAAQKDGDCFIFPYYRNLALKLAAGLSPMEAMLSFMGRKDDLYSGGRQFPLQGADLKHKIIQISNVVAAGMTQAVGYALGCKMLNERTVVLTYFGDGASSEGECHEAMNFAGVHRLPVVFICENNRYAISVPQDKQMAIRDLAQRASGYGMPGHVVDGMDTLAAFEAARDAISHARVHGPVLLEMKVERFMPHTTDDDDRRYRPSDELDTVRQRDPLLLLRVYLSELGLLTEEDDQRIQGEAKTEVNRVTDAAESAPLPDAATMHDNVYAP